MEKSSTRRPKLTATSSSRDRNDDDDDLPLGNDVLNTSNNLSQSPVVVVAQSSYNRTPTDNANTKSHSNFKYDDNYPVYSAALIITIGVGCTLLLLNILVFVAVYYRDKSNRSRHYRNCQRRKRHHEHCDSTCSISNSSLRDTPDICTKICKQTIENGGIKSNFTSAAANEGTQSSNIQKTAQLQSILKKPQQLPSSSQSSMLILQPAQHLSKEMPIELSNFRFTTNKSSTLPRPPPPPRIPKSPDLGGSFMCRNYKMGGTLDRKTVHTKEYEDLRV